MKKIITSIEVLAVGKMNAALATIIEPASKNLRMNEHLTIWFRNAYSRGSVCTCHWIGGGC